jgi:HSP20 family molecular chaperone IbpA
MEDEDAAERIQRFLKANGYPVRKSDITQILNQMTQALERQIEQSNGFGERPLLCEVIRFSKEIKVITELPGAFNININIQDNELEIDAQSETRRYYEIVLLPAEAAAKVLKSTFSNGTLELTFKRKKIKSRARPA